MTRRGAWIARFALLTLAMVLATIVLGWVGIIFVGVVFAAMDGRDTTALESGGGAAAAWALILLITALWAGARPIGIVGAALGAPVIAIPAVSILFAGGLAWSSAAVVLLARRAVLGPRSANVPAESVGQ